MMEALNLFPARIAIGQFTDPDDPKKRFIKVYATPEFNRALSAVFGRIGGAFGLDTSSLEVLASFTPMETETTASGLGLPTVDAGGADVAALREQLAGATAQLESFVAHISPLLRRIESLELQQPLAPTGVANSLASPSTYPANAVDLASVIALANAIKANNLAKNV